MCVWERVRCGGGEGGAGEKWAGEMRGGHR